MGNVSDVGCYVSSTLITVGNASTTALPFPALKNSSDKLLVTLPMLLCSRLPVSLLDPQPILDRIAVFAHKVLV
jgi:hypothetical protein